MSTITPEQAKQAADFGRRTGKWLALISIVLLPAAVIEAVWTGEWRWLILAAPCYLFMRAAIRHALAK